MIKMTGIQKTYGKDHLFMQVLNELELFVRKGEMLAIMGSSGSGKSTLLNLIAGISRSDRGEYYFNGKKIDYNNKKQLEHLRRYDLSMIVQYFALIDDLNVYENVALPLRYQKKKKNIKYQVYRALEQLNLTNKEAYYPDELSGGEKQRTAIARAIVSEPKVILADEPTGSLDKKNTRVVLEILKKLREDGCTIVIATHDMEVARYCDRICHIDDGKLISGEKRKGCGSDFISEKFTENL